MPGTIRSVSKLLVTVEFLENPPELRELLIAEPSKAPLLVDSYLNDTTAACINLLDEVELEKGTVVERTNKSVETPVGTETLGHIFDALGRCVDDPSFVAQNRRNIYAPLRSRKSFQLGKAEILETGIKVLDFFTPFVKGRKIGIVGGAGVGKTVLTMELIHNVGKQDAAVAMFTGIGERIREGHELYETLKERGLLENTAMFFAQMNENPALRAMVAETSVATAEYFRDDEHKDILYFADNIYRFVQARNELGTILGQMPSEGGYQATLFSDVKTLQDRLSSTENGSITSVQTIYVPADDLSDPAVQMISAELDSVIVLSRDVAAQGIRPAVDLSKTTSSLLSPDIVGEEHYALAEQVQIILHKYNSLKSIIAIIGEAELSPDDKKAYDQARKLIDFFNQEAHVAEDLSGRKGEFVPREVMLKGVSEIVNG